MKHRKQITSSTPFVRVGPSGVHGLGAFATRDLPPEAFLGLYEGRRYTKAEIATKVWNDQLTYLFTLSNHETIDGAKGGNATRHLNHSCEPNCEAVEEYDEGGELVLKFQTLTAVDAGDELFIDYSTTARRPPSTPAIAARRIAGGRCWRLKRKPRRPPLKQPAPASGRLALQLAQLLFGALKFLAKRPGFLLQPVDAGRAALGWRHRLALRLQRAQGFDKLPSPQHLAPGTREIDVALQRRLFGLASRAVRRHHGLCESRQRQAQRKGREEGFDAHAAR